MPRCVYSVTTQVYENGVIKQTHYDGNIDIIKIVNLADEEVKNALKKLGWCEPQGNEHILN